MTAIRNIDSLFRMCPLQETRAGRNNQITQQQDDVQVPFTGILFSCQYNTTPSPTPPDPYPYPSCTPNTIYFPTYVAISIDNNRIESDELEYGIRINMPGNLPTSTSPIEYWRQLFIGKGNYIGATTATGEKISVFGNTQKPNKYLIAQNPIASQWIANGSPEGLVSGQQGTTGIDKTREADNKYQLNSIDGNTGWTLISEMGRQVLVEDEFIGSGSLNAHTPGPINAFNSPPWTFFNGSWSINNNEARATAITIQQIGSIAYINTPISDGSIKAIFRNQVNTNGIGIGIVFRKNGNDFWRCYYDNSSGIIYLDLVSNLSPTNKFQKNVVVGNSFCFIIEVKMKKNFISVFFNELLLFSTNDSFNNIQTQHGIMSKSLQGYQTCQNFKLLLN